MGFKQERDTSGMRRYWPLIGFFMLIGLGAISYLIAPDVVVATKDLFPQFSTPGVNRELVRIGFAVVIFFILALVSGAIVAIAQPRSKMNIKDKDLMKMREQMLAAKDAERARLRKVNRDLRNR